MKFAFFGCGSIGQRHIRNLLDLGYSDFCAFRTKKGHYKSIPSDLKIIEFDDWNDIIDYNPDVAFITNPTSEHIKTAIKIAPHVKAIFIEKPISNNFNDLETLEQLIIDYNIVLFVGYNLLFHPISEEIRHIINNGSLGQPIVFQGNMGQWLPDWHPYEDYKNAYYSQKELGGGITLTMIHELNLARKFLGGVKRVSAFLPISTNLEVDVDINSNIMLYHNNGAVSQIHLDCIQKVMNRSGNIYFERGWISYDFISSELKIKNENDVKEKMIWNDLNFDPNEMYKKELLTFIDLVDNKDFKHEYDFYNAKLDLGIVEDVFKYQT